MSSAWRRQQAEEPVVEGVRRGRRTARGRAGADGEARNVDSGASSLVSVQAVPMATTGGTPTRAAMLLRESERAAERDAADTGTAPEPQETRATVPGTGRPAPIQTDPASRIPPRPAVRERPKEQEEEQDKLPRRAAARPPQRLAPLEGIAPGLGMQGPTPPLERAGLSVYTYNVNTSSLELQGASRDAEGAIGVETVRGFSESQPSVMYVESAVGRGFRRVDLRGASSWAAGAAPSSPSDADAVGEGSLHLGGRSGRRRRHGGAGKGAPRQIQTTRPFLFSVSHWNASVSSTVLHFAEGILGGVCVVVFAMTFFFDAPNLPAGFLRYYSEIAPTVSRLIITLSAISFAGACERYARNSIRGWAAISGFSGRTSSRPLSAAVILLYAISLVVSVVEYPFEEQMYYASQRVKNWWNYPTSSEFDSALDTWHAANFFRLFCCVLAWLLVRHRGIIQLLSLCSFRPFVFCVLLVLRSCCSLRGRWQRLSSTHTGSACPRRRTASSVRTDVLRQPYISVRGRVRARRGHPVAYVRARCRRRRRHVGRDDLMRHGGARW